MLIAAASKLSPIVQRCGRSATFPSPPLTVAVTATALAIPFGPTGGISGLLEILAGFSPAGPLVLDSLVISLHTSANAAKVYPFAKNVNLKYERLSFGEQLDLMPKKKPSLG